MRRVEDTTEPMTLNGFINCIDSIVSVSRVCAKQSIQELNHRCHRLSEHSIALGADNILGGLEVHL